MGAKVWVRCADHSHAAGEGSISFKLELKAAGYDVQYVEFNGLHAIQPAIVGMAIEFFLK